MTSCAFLIAASSDSTDNSRSIEQSGVTTMMPRILSTLVLSALLPVAATNAQTSETGSDPVTAALEVGRSVLNAERQAVIAKSLPLTREEGERFWPVYREYHDKAGEIMGRRLELIRSYAENYDRLTDDMAEDLIERVLKNDEAETRLKKKYLGRFKKVLPADKLVTYFQLENKIDTYVRARLVEQVPLLTELDR
jgi:hypothetical protein